MLFNFVKIHSIFYQFYLDIVATMCYNIREVRKGAKKMNMIKKYTTKTRTFRVAPDGKFISVYQNGKLNGFIWNCDKRIMIDGEEIISSEFFR